MNFDLTHMVEKMSKTKKLKSLSEQLKDLSTPQPVSYHPDQEDQDDFTAAKVVEFSYEEEPWSSKKRKKVVEEFDDDPKYSGRAINRRDLQDSEESNDELDEQFSDDDDDQEQSDVVDSDDESDQSDAEDGDHMTDSDDPEPTPSQDQPQHSIATISLASLQEDIEKGKAAKHQLGLWDGVLEARIKLHRVLVGVNKLPQEETLEAFLTAGGEGVQTTHSQCQSVCHDLMDDLLELQRSLLLRNSETSCVVGGASNDGDGDMGNEEIPSDSDDSDEELEPPPPVVGRKRERPEWVCEDSSLDYEGYLSSVHTAFQAYRDETIAKWNTKTRIAGGKVTSKSFVQVDQTVLSQIKHILADKPRLLKRTQLKRSVYRVLGTCEGAGKDTTDQSDQSRDAHLKDYDEEIFDDDDFYHQLLRELIERKMDTSEGGDPVAMGRQWLQLQKLRAKAKKDVDTRASKGRKIRYNVHPKLANFMVPVETGTMSDVTKNDLFSSLFGAHQRTLRT